MIITALIGYPTAHSFSPTLFAIYAKEHKLEYSHLKIDVAPRNIASVLEAIKLLNFAGLNVTSPYKSNIIKYLNRIDSEARRIGAVNTIVNQRGKLYGYNTDMYGAIKSMEKKMGQRIDARHKCFVFGTGGSARAIIQGLANRKSKIAVCYREPESLRTKSMMKDFGKDVFFVKNSKMAVNYISKADIICNATTAGMYPHVEVLPTEKDYIVQAMTNTKFSQKLFFDVVFRPYRSQFLEVAAGLGAKTQGGAEMMIYQGELAFELWTGYKVSNQTLKSAISNLKKMLG